MVTKSFICPNGHRWRATDDRQQCPVCGAKVAETIANGNAQFGSTADGTPAPVRSQEAVLSQFGRYEIIEELGRGGMGIVYRAYDPVHDRQVALKTLPYTDPTLLSRFKREFRVLASVDHPNVVKLFELTSDGETWFFTMEIIDGVDLLDYVGYGPIDRRIEIPDEADIDPALTQDMRLFELSRERLQRIRDGFVQLAGAIAALHANGIVHRDIKPSNVIVTPGGRVVLLDFGLVAETDPSGIHQSLHQQVMGTAAYMSPEQAACEQISLASDCYSLGVMLYQSLTHRLPFSGKILDILVDKQNLDPVPPHEIQPSISQEWNDLCLASLCRDPLSRLSADDILQRLGGAEQQSTRTPPSAQPEVVIVGRERQLGALNEAWQAVQRGRSKCVFVEGASGTGKSALVEAFVDQVTPDGAVVLRGRCYEMESVPFKAIDSLIDSLVVHLSHLPPADSAALMPRDVHALVRLFPVIGQVEAVASLPRREIDVSDQKELNRRAIGALRELLSRMGDRIPLVVYIDDLQWGDEDSAAMLSDLLQPPDPPVLLFLGTYRSEDADTSQFLQSFRKIQRQRNLPLDSFQVEVTPLQQSDAVNLALELLKCDDLDAQLSAESIARESAGNPFFVSELVKHLQVDGDRFSNSTEPLVLVDMIWSRVQRLPDESQRLLAVVALWGRPLPLDQAMRIADVGQLAVGPLRSGHLIRTVGLASSSRVETYHDRVRESVAQHLDHATKQEVHLRIAENCASQSPLGADEITERLDQYFVGKSTQVDDHLEVASIWYEAAFHFDAAGRADLAFPYALVTAEKARAQFSLEMAEQQFRIAERGVTGDDVGVKYRIAEGLGDVFMLRGNYDEARVRFDRAQGLAECDVATAEINGKLGELAFKQGDMQTAIEASERALALLGHRVPQWSVLFLFRLLREAFVQVLHSVLPALFVGRKKLVDADNQLLVIRLHNRLAYAYWFECGKVPCPWTHLRGMNLAERYPPTPELAQAYSIHAPVMSLIASFSRGVAYAQKSLAAYKSLDDRWGQGQSLHFYGTVLYAASRFEECIEKCREAVRLLERTGDFWEVNVARYHIALSLYRRGDLADAVGEARRMHEAGLELGDIQASGGALDPWVRASGGKVDRERVQIELQHPRYDVQGSAMVMLADGVQLFMLGRTEEAAVVFEEAYQLAAKAGVKNVYVYPHLPWLATALRHQAEKTSDLTPERRSALLKRAAKVAKQALRVARKFQNDLPHALREAGLICALQDSGRRSRKYLDESLDVAQRQGARFEYAQTLLARGSVGLKFDWHGAAAEVATARQTLSELGADFVIAQYEQVEAL